MGEKAPRAVEASGRSPFYPNDQANGVVQGSFAAVGVSAPFAFYGWFNVSIWAALNEALTTTIGSLSAAVAAAGTIAKGNGVVSPNVPPGTIVGALTGTTATLVVPPITVRGKSKVNSAVITFLDFTDGLLGAAVTGLGVPAGTTVSSVDVVAIPKNVNGVLTKGQITLSAAVTAANDDNSDTPFVFVRTGNAILVGSADAAATFVGDESVFVGTVQLERSFDGGLTFIPVSLTNKGDAVAKWTANVSTSFMEPERGVLYRLNCIAYTSGGLNYRLSGTGQAATTLNVPL